MQQTGIIIGGGIAGLTAAIALHQRGIGAVVCEAAPQILPLGAGIWIAPNAIKFTEQGRVEVRYSWQAQGNERGTARFEIIDTGIGIPDERVGNLFSRFTQVDASSTRRFGGTGLGLAISKQLVELMGGRIGVTTKLGKGSMFWFEVPWCGGNPALKFAPGNADQLPVMTRKLLVLVADDNRVNRMIVEMLLKKHGHVVDTVANGREAVEAVQTATYDLVLMDVQMPEMDGTTATRLIRKLPAPICHVPIIAVTAHALPGHREEYLAAGMNDYVAKPLRALELFTAMLRVLPKTDNRIGATAPNHTEIVSLGRPDKRAVETADRSSSVDEKGVIASLPLIDRMMLGGWSDGLDRAAVRGLLDGVPSEVGLCLNELKTAIAAGDIVQAKRAAHRLKGMASNLGATRLAGAARDLEVNTSDAVVATAKLEDLERTMTETLVELRMIA